MSYTSDKSQIMTREHIEWLKLHCSRLMYGQCTTHSCIKRGGWTGGSFDPDIATCIPYEILKKVAEEKDGDTN